MNDLTNLTDHDLLITLIGEVKSLREDIKRTSDDATKFQADHETRIRALERSRWIAAGASGVLASGLTLAINYFINK